MRHHIWSNRGCMASVLGLYISVCIVCRMCRIVRDTKMAWVAKSRRILNTLKDLYFMRLETIRSIVIS